MPLNNFLDPVIKCMGVAFGYYTLNISLSLLGTMQILAAGISALASLFVFLYFVTTIKKRIATDYGGDWKVWIKDITVNLFKKN